jgi:hypothetical protein
VIQAKFSVQKIDIHAGDGGTKSGEKEVEHIHLSGGHLGKDEIVREATEADKRQYADEYELFKNPPPPEVTHEEHLAAKDAEIATLKAELAKKGSA